MQTLTTMTVWTLQACIFALVAIAMTAQSPNHLAPQVVYQKLEHALITDSKVVYLMQNSFFPSQGSSRDIVIIGVNVTVDSMPPGNCDEHFPLSGTPINFSYYQEFQWSSSPLLNLISVDQLLILENIMSERIYFAVEHHQILQVLLHIDTLPCNTSEDDILQALMQLLPWVCTPVYVWHNFEYCYIIIMHCV